MAVRLRMKRLGRRHRPFFRICAMDARAPRNGRAIEELGTYDPMVPETDARAILKGDRIDYWLGVGALPSEKVKVLIKKYGTGGSHIEQQRAALDRLAARRQQAIAPVIAKAEEAPPEEEAAPAEETPDDAPVMTEPQAAETQPEDISAETPPETPSETSN